ncbi:MAG TPA: hypothetical protein VHP58_06520 [Alphaproteobacteria bacterium]|nr:hypothetical protein [Alphaproteobacteria bacterium]
MNKLHMQLTMVALAAGALGMLAGCASVLPSTSNKSQVKWESYGSAKDAFDAVIETKTTEKDLGVLGFNPNATPNTKILNYVDVVNLFGSSFKPEQLPEGVQKCAIAKDKCFAYVVQVQSIKNKQEGSVLANLFGFRKNIRTKGWQFTATIVLIDKTVAYKLWTGTPEIESVDNSVTPLGPMQNLGFLVPKPGF